MKRGVIALLMLPVVAAACGRQEGGVTFDESAIRPLLDDRTRPWFQGHKVPTPNVIHLAYVQATAMGAFTDPPAKFPVMPVPLARHLTAGTKTVPAGHPFHGRPALLFDMRLRSLHLLEHIPGSSQTAWRDLNDALTTGPLKDMDRKTVVILYGERYPHFDAPNSFRSRGFDAVYCLEGGLKAWKEKGLPVVSNASAGEYARQLESEHTGTEKTGEVHQSPENIAPLALMSMMDLGIKPLIVFVGDHPTYIGGHLPGATRVTLEEFPQRFEGEDRNRPILVYCGCCTGMSKGFSGMAIDRLKIMGFKKLFHLEGHLAGWKELGLPLVIGEDPDPKAKTP
jgi:rhodanese-related sulfurtransferase